MKTHYDPLRPTLEEETSKNLRFFIMVLMGLCIVVINSTLNAQCLHQIKSSYEVYNRFSILDNYSIDSLTDLEIIRMTPKHHKVDKDFCIKNDSISKTTKEYSWLLNEDTQEAKLYDKVVIDENGVSLYKHGSLVHYEESVEIDNSMFDYSGESIAMIGYEHPVKWLSQQSIDSIITAGYSVTTLTNDSTFIIDNNSISIIHNVKNQYTL